MYHEQTPLLQVKLVHYSSSIVGYVALNPPLPLLLEDLILDPVSTRRSATVYENISVRSPARHHQLEMSTPKRKTKRKKPVHNTPPTNNDGKKIKSGFAEECDPGIV